MIRLAHCSLLFAVCLVAAANKTARPRPPQPVAGDPPPLGTGFKQSPRATYVPASGKTARPRPPQPVAGDPPPLGTGFKELSPRASYTLASGSYYLTSPNYPYRYPNFAWRRWVLTGDSGQTLSIACNNIDIESHSSCSYDFLKINGQKFCGSTSTGTISGTTLTIVFSSDESVRRFGFRCDIEVSSGGATTAATTTAATTAGTTTPSSGQCCGLPNRGTRIVGGVETEVNEYPWQAGLVSTGGTRTWCGGSVINNRYVLTAAHCTDGSSASQIQVLLREHIISQSDGELRYNVQQIIEHPSYSAPSTTGYDFALLKLSTTINFSSLNNRVAPVCLPTGGSFANVNAIVSGWGTTSSGGSQATRLREVTVQTMSNSQCSQAYGNSINPTMLCAGVSGGGKDSCQGDSGGPLVTDVSGRYTLIGVVSWGSGCALANYPGVYARVTAVSSWIQQNTADASLC